MLPSSTFGAEASGAAGASAAEPSAGAGAVPAGLRPRNFTGSSPARTIGLASM